MLAEPVEATVVALTFDGTTCHYEGPEQVPEGTVDLRFSNTSDQPFAVAAMSVKEHALADFLSEGSVGTDWDIPTGHPRSGGLDWHNRWPLVPVGESHEFSWLLPAGTYYFDCVLSLDHVWRTAQLEVVAVASEATTATTRPTHNVGGDLLLVMEPGSGPGVEAEMMLGLNIQGIEVFGVADGTANFVARAYGPYGGKNIVTFTAGRENPRGGDPELCFMFLPGGGGCGHSPDEPTIYGFSSGSVEAFGGSEAAEAVFTTESGSTVSVLTVDGWVYAEWPGGWGLPLTGDFYDASGFLIATLTVP